MSSQSREQPPAGPPWDQPLAGAPLAFVDLEMSGLDPARDRVLEICIERVQGGQIMDRLATLVRPDDGCPVAATEIHGIRDVDVVDAPEFGAIAPRIEALVDGAIVVAHGAEWDVAFLHAEMARAHRPWRLLHGLDTLPLSRRAFALESHRLQAIARALSLQSGRPHRAADDVALLRQLFARLVSFFVVVTPRQLWQIQMGKRVVPEHIVAAARRAAELSCAVSIRYRPSTGPPRELMFCVRSVRTDLDPPLVLGYLQPTRGRRELRADRILSIEMPGQ